MLNPLASWWQVAVTLRTEQATRSSRGMLYRDTEGSVLTKEKWEAWGRAG